MKSFEFQIFKLYIMVCEMHFCSSALRVTYVTFYMNLQIMTYGVHIRINMMFPNLKCVIQISILMMNFHFVIVEAISNL